MASGFDRGDRFERLQDDLRRANNRIGKLTDFVLEAQDAVAILTAHAGIDHRRIVDMAALVFDARGVTKPLQRPNLVRL